MVDDDFMKTLMKEIANDPYFTELLEERLSSNIKNPQNDE